MADLTHPRVEPARFASRAMVCTVDHLASGAGLRAFHEGGNAVDAAIAASAALAVTTQHMCGMGGDLWALVHVDDEEPTSLNASGRSGSGTDAAAMRAEGLTAMPFRGDVRSIPVPGCVDGWMALHHRYGSLGLDRLLAPAIELAEHGFPATDSLANATRLVASVDGASDYLPGGRLPTAGQIIRRPGIARSLRGIAEIGRSAWYEGEFGEGLLRLGDGLFTAEDLATSHADWVTPLSVDAWDHTIWTVPANSQGYLALLSAAIVEEVGLAAEPGDPAWAHLLIEASKQAATDRRTQLHESADLQALMADAEVKRRAEMISPDRAGSLSVPAAGGGTIYMCTADETMSVSLMNSNAAGFGSHLAVSEVGVFLHNRGIGFSLDPDHPAGLAPGRRPPSTLSPALVSRSNGERRAVLGTMGGDGQPQVVLQMLARLLAASTDSGVDPGEVLSAARFTLTVPDAVGFDTWDKADSISVALEAGSGWADGLRSVGHDVDERPWGQSLFGHAHLIDIDGQQGTLYGAAEPRTGSSAAVGL